MTENIKPATPLLEKITQALDLSDRVGHSRTPENAVTDEQGSMHLNSLVKEIESDLFQLEERARTPGRSPSPAVAWFVSGPKLSRTVYAHGDIEPAIAAMVAEDPNSDADDYTATAMGVLGVRWSLNTNDNGATPAAEYRTLANKWADVTESEEAETGAVRQRISFTPERLGHFMDAWEARQTARFKRSAVNAPDLQAYLDSNAFCGLPAQHKEGAEMGFSAAAAFVRNAMPSVQCEPLAVHGWLGEGQQLRLSRSIDTDAELVLASDANERIALMALQIEALKARLEIDQRTVYDGIAARDITIHEQDKTILEMRAAIEQSSEIMAEVHRALKPKTRSANGPGHDHAIEGVWDKDNKIGGGTPCAWCLTWKKFSELVAR